MAVQNGALCDQIAGCVRKSKAPEVAFLYLASGQACGQAQVLVIVANDAQRIVPQAVADHVKIRPVRQGAEKTQRGGRAVSLPRRESRTGISATRDGLRG